MVKVKVPGLLHFEENPNLVIRGYLPAERINEALQNRLFFILLTRNTTKTNFLKIHNVPGQVNGDISTIFSPETPQNSSQDDRSLRSVAETISTNKQPAQLTSEKEEEMDCRTFIVITEEHSKYNKSLSTC